MGYHSDLQIEIQQELEEEKMEEWIRERLDDPDANEISAEWLELQEAFYDQKEWEYNRSDEEEFYDEFEVEDKTPYEVFDSALDSSSILIKSNAGLAESHRQNLYVMIYGHVISATEGYLYSTFVNLITDSDSMLQKFIEKDLDYSREKICMRDFFTKKKSLKNDVKKFLKKIVFHNISRVKPMYKKILNIDVGNPQWLYRAIEKRHDCVHRAGFNHEGNSLDLQQEEISALINSCLAFVNNIEACIKK